jgi:hypothetical protein
MKRARTWHFDTGADIPGYELLKPADQKELDRLCDEANGRAEERELPPPNPEALAVRVGVVTDR